MWNQELDKTLRTTTQCWETVVETNLILAMPRTALRNYDLKEEVDSDLELEAASEQALYAGQAVPSSPSQLFWWALLDSGAAYNFVS